MDQVTQVTKVTNDTDVIDVGQHLVADAECLFFHLSVDGKSTVGREENHT